MPASSRAAPATAGGGPAGLLPAGVQVIERDWLSSNHVLLGGGGGPLTMVDTGYASHAPLTVALIDHALGGRRPDWLLNTHLHSDHCGGNAALQARHPGLHTLVPAGQRDVVARWDAAALPYETTGQSCARFRADEGLRAGTQLRLGACVWEVHAAPGHDPHSVILFEPASRALISADALWASGLGIVFPELEGQDAFAEAGHTLDQIERLRPRVVIPGHGAVFTTVDAALASARQRLESFARDPQRHTRYAAKVLIKFRLLEQQRLGLDALLEWAAEMDHMRLMHRGWFAGTPLQDWLRGLVDELAHAKALEICGSEVFNR